MRVVGSLVTGLVLCLAGCASTVGGDPRPDPGAPRSSSSAPAVDPNSREARWLNDLCGAGKRLITAGETLPQPQVSDDPAVLKREFSELTGRLLDVFDAALSDLRRLRPAPVSGMDDVIGTIVDHMSTARDTTSHAKSIVDAADPLTVEAYDEAVNELGRGLMSLQKAVDFLKVIDLPEELDGAAEAAPNCAGDTGFPVGER